MVEALALRSIPSNLSSSNSPTLMSRLPICNCDLNHFGWWGGQRKKEAVRGSLARWSCAQGPKAHYPPPTKGQGSVAVGGGLPHRSHSPGAALRAPCQECRGFRGLAPCKLGVCHRGELGPGHCPASRQLLLAWSSTPSALLSFSSFLLPSVPL